MNTSQYAFVDRAQEAETSNEPGRGAPEEAKALIMSFLRLVLLLQMAG